MKKKSECIVIFTAKSFSDSSKGHFHNVFACISRIKDRLIRRKPDSEDTGRSKTNNLKETKLSNPQASLCEKYINKISGYSKFLGIVTILKNGDTCDVCY